MRFRRLAAMALAIGLLGALPASSSADTFRVRAVGSSPTDFKWDPSFRHIIKGDRVVWKNTTEASHRVVAYKGRWSKDTTIAPAETTSKRFRRTGTYKYRCTLPGHSTLTDGNCQGMCGTVHVTT
jgi:plastocyanin